MRGAPIHFRPIAFLLLGAIVGGFFFGFLFGKPISDFTHSKFVMAFILSASLYGSLLLGYHWTAQEQEWVGLRARFSPVGRKPLIVGAAIAIGMIALTWITALLLKWAGIKIADVPSPFEMESYTQLPLAILLIVILAPFCEELIFRGLLLDWLKAKMNVWLAAFILSVLFSLLHANPFSLGAIGWLAFTERFLLGLAASALTIKYGSLRPSLVMHATNNAIAGFAGVFNLA